MDEKSDPKIENALVDSIGKYDSASLVTDWAEVGLDAILEGGIVRDIPVIGSLVKLAGMAFTVRDRMFAKKILLFLKGLSSIPLEKRVAAIEKLGDESERQKTGEQLLLLLDRMNDMSKPIMLANAYKAYLEERVTFAEFQELAFAIDAVNVATLDTLKRSYNNVMFYQTTKPGSHVQHLAMCGLFSIEFKKIDTTAVAAGHSIGGSEKPGGVIAKNKFGKLFCQVVLEMQLQ